MIAELAAALVEVWNELDLPRGNLPYAAERRVYQAVEKLRR
jgi:hypothetical protein